MPSSGLHTCPSTVEERAAKELKSLIIGKNNNLDGFLKIGEISKASQLALSVLKSANEKTECGQPLSQHTKALVGALKKMQSQIFTFKTTPRPLTHL